MNTDVSPLANTVQQITLSDLEATMSETNLAILYVADDSNYDLDNEILKRVNTEGVNDYFYYMNVEDISKSEIIDSLKNYFNNLSEDINSIPMIIYIKDGVAVKVIDSKDWNLTVNDFNVILDSYLEID